MRRLPPIARNGPSANQKLAGGPFSPVYDVTDEDMPIATNSSRLARVKLADLIARIVIVAGGLIVIGSVIAVMLLLISVIFPLFGGTSTEVEVACPLPDVVGSSEVLRVGVDRVELGESIGNDALSAYTLTKDGVFSFFDFVPDSDGEHEELKPALLAQMAVEPPDGSPNELVSVDQASPAEFTLVWADGAVSMVEASAVAEFDDLGSRSVRYDLERLADFGPDEDGQTVRAIGQGGEEGSATCARLLDDNRIVVEQQTVVTTLFGAGETETSRLVIDDAPGRVTALAVNREGDTLFAGTDEGHLERWKFDDDGEILLHESTMLPDSAAVTAMTMVFGDVSVAVGDAKGRVTTWAPVRTEESGETQSLRLIHELSRHNGAVREILPSQRNKSLLSLGADGTAHLDYMTSEKKLATLAADTPVVAMGYSPRGNAMVGLDADKMLRVWQIDSPHPEISWQVLFGKVWYDSHDEPKYLWQSSGTDEPKFSLVPVIFGTLKATVYAMFFAVPLALFSAMYVSHFTTPAFKRTIKPIVEVMAAVPTVVIGFLILLWVGPEVGNWIVGVFISFVSIPLTFLAFMMLWQLMRRTDFAKRVENGYEFLVLIPVVVLGAAIAVMLTAPVESALFADFDGDFRQWLFETMNMRYDQLNSLVVALGLGFAVIPIIFSISEDSLSDIPHSLTAASLAMGASRWQTVWRVILPSASPGIFAAVMIGFGRAVGETMIVFMATGNTPILDWSPFNGFRTLSANIAVEISEAPRDGTLYRVLFLCAVLLFLMTFLLNTVAELVRSRLRKKYGRL